MAQGSPWPHDDGTAVGSRPAPTHIEADTVKHLLLLMAITLGPPHALAQDAFGLRFDHSTVLVRDLDVGVAFYTNVLQLEELETPWGPTAPIRFYAMGGGRQLHMGLTDGPIQPDKNVHLAFAVEDFDGYLGFLTDHDIEYSDFAGRSRRFQTRPDGVRQIYLQDPDGNWIEVNDAGPAP